ncbi:MAG TPA: glycosyltransferase N-terminal domain-containing protein, partial [Elusimicrobiota bacterium]|nr:glycosyltransferase N-terminal domain-containing protein [Elusimicrobiota bacterium]
NGRLSDKAFRAYSLLGGFWRRVFSRLSMVGAQSARNADRFRTLGVPSDRVRVVGNLKYDVQPKRAADLAARRRKYGFTPDDFIWICGSTHEGEEETLLKAFIGMRRKGESIKMILAPRNIDRAGGLLAAVKDHGPFRGERRSLLSSDPGELDVLVLDVMGELGELYQLGQVAFVGGSLIRHGGQNPLEPARYGVPVLFGPSMENFSEMVESFLKEKGAVVVRDSQDLLACLKLYRGDESERLRAGAAAARVAGLQSGAVERTLAMIESALSS